MILEKTTIQGIYTHKLKDNYTYYFKFRHPLTKKSSRKKIFTKDKKLKKYDVEAKILANTYIENLTKTKPLEQKQEVEKHIFKDYTLNELADLYFKDRVELKQRKLKQYYSHLSDKDFQDNKTIQRQIYNTKKSSSQYNVNVRNVYFTYDVLDEIKNNNYDENSKFGTIKIKDLSRRVATKFLHSILGKTRLSTKSKFNIISQLKTIFNWGNIEDLIDIQNPFIHLKMTNDKNRRVRVLSNKEIKLMLDKAKTRFGVFSNVYLCLYLGVLTAARKTTILNIRVKDIDLHNKVIHLTNYKNNNKYYQVPINDESCNWFKDKLFKKYKNKDECIVKSEIVNKDNIDNLQPLSKIPLGCISLLDELFNENLDKRNNQERNFVVSFHTLRRSRATNLIKDDLASVYEVMKLLNHSSIKQTEEYLSLDSNILNQVQTKSLNMIFK